MVVRTRDLLNYIRCPRFAALDSVRRINQENHLLAHQSAYSSSHLEDKSDETDELENSFSFFESTNASSLKNYYKELFYQVLKQKYPNARITGHIEQTLTFEAEYQLSAYVDFQVELEDEIHHIKLSMATSNHLLQLKYHLNKQKYPLFVQNERGEYIIDTPIWKSTDSTNYEDKLEKVIDRHSDMGRIFYDLMFTKKVFQSTHTLPSKMYLIVLSSDYVYSGKTHTPDLFTWIDYTPILETHQEIIETDLYRMINHIELNDDSRCLLVKEECLYRHSFECEYASYCFEHVPKKNSILDYMSNHLGFKEGPQKNDLAHDTYDMLNEGIVDMIDVPISWLQREKNLMQRYCVENDYTYLHKKKVSTKLNELIYPLYFLDFEANPSPIPLYQQEKPYTQSVFQFSVHIQNRKGHLDRLTNLTHLEYLSNPMIDDREELILELLNAIPSGDSHIIVYNETFERNRLLELAEVFPVYKDRLLELESRLFDLLKVLKTDVDFYLQKGFSKQESERYNFYHPNLSGSYSIKKVLPIFSDLTYDQLEIQNGVMAYEKYLMLPYLSGEAQTQIRKQLLDYCKQDTYAMVLILEGLYKMLGK